MNLIVGNIYENIKCESFKDPESSRVRVRPLEGQNLPTKIVIECSKSERAKYPLGTKFITESVKVCSKPDGRVYLRAKDQLIKRYNLI